MTVLYANVFFVFVFSLLARFLAEPDSLSPATVKPNKYFAGLAASSLVLVAGLRSNIGDTYYYIHSYVTNEYTWEEIDFTGDFGFNLLQMVLQQISRDPQLLLFITAFLTNVLITMTLYHYSRLFEISMYVYITLGFFLVSMNGIRQYLAAAILFAATTYIIQGAWKRYFVIVLVASTIHQTALIMIPVYFIVRSPAWSKMTIVLILGSVALVIGFNHFMDILFRVIEDTQYGGYEDFQEGGANSLRVLVAAAPILLAYIGRERLQELFPKSDVIVNMALISLLFMLISTQNWIFARFSIYFGLYQLILVSWVVKVFAQKDQRLIYFGIVICYFIYFIYEHVVTLDIIYHSPYLPFK
ncbi:EpsG family protein [Halalkalibacter hemicellulosilyticus]|uniref:EpsG family protein n=1 Tax=Halalkalibacter hemicellulosilyticus TaxID=127886 RepID=UPI0005545FE3|nr:EpsG family protein [Halalkalibacter hemicellulosilyticus]